MNKVLPSFKIKDIYIRLQLKFILFTIWRSSSLSVESYVNILQFLSLITDLYVSAIHVVEKNIFNLVCFQQIEIFKTCNLYSSHVACLDIQVGCEGGLGTEWWGR